jgi:hypothetical protein
MEMEKRGGRYNSGVDPCSIAKKGGCQKIGGKYAD